MILSNRKNISKIQLVFFVAIIVLFCSLVLGFAENFDSTFISLYSFFGTCSDRQFTNEIALI